MVQAEKLPSGLGTLSVSLLKSRAAAVMSASVMETETKIAF
jgi:hypothetical protein